MSSRIRRNMSPHERSRLNEHKDYGQDENIEYAVYCIQGMRNEMEDAFTAQNNFYGLKGWYFYGVYDGHGGDLCSKIVGDQLVKHVVYCLLKEVDPKIPKGVENLKISRDHEKLISKLATGQIENVLIKAFESMDEELDGTPDMKKEEENSGTTAVVVLMSPTHIFIANCGDSRAILVRKGMIEASTFDHKPTQLRERQRIQNAGGMVALQRVNGGLATSRGLGDFEYKNVKGFPPNKQYVTSEPDTYVIRRSKDDDFIVLACDGIWDVLSNEDVSKYFIETSKSPLNTVLNDLLDKCLDKGSRDNMSTIAIRFR